MEIPQVGGGHEIYRARRGDQYIHARLCYAPGHGSLECIWEVSQRCLNTLARLAYKQNVDDDGESLSCCIIEDLEHVRAVVSNSDPYIPVI